MIPRCERCGRWACVRWLGVVCFCLPCFAKKQAAGSPSAQANTP